MLASAEQVKSCEELLNEFQRSRPASFGEKLIFSGVGTRDVYNITAPFEDEGDSVIAGRVESRDNEASEVMFFVNRGDVWIPREGAPVFTLQDPFVSFIRGACFRRRGSVF